MNDEDLDKLLLEAGRSIRSSEAVSSQPGPDCPPMEQLEAMVEGKLDNATLDKLRAHTGECLRCTRLFTLIAHADAPLPEARLEAIVSKACASVKTPPVPEPTPGPPWDRAWRWLRVHLGLSDGSGTPDNPHPHPRPYPGPMVWRPVTRGGALIIACMLVVVLQTKYGYHPNEVHNYALQVAGAEKHTLGPDETSPPPGSGSEEPVFTQNSSIEARVYRHGTLSIDDEAMAVVVKLQNGSTKVVYKDEYIEKDADGLWLRADGATLFGKDPGEVELWFVVAPARQLPARADLQKDAEEVRVILSEGAKKGRWWWDTYHARYVVSTGP